MENRSHREPDVSALLGEGALTRRVLIVDDHPIFIDALQLALHALRDDADVLSAPSLAAACYLLKTCSAELVLLDLMLPDGGGVDGVARIREAAPQARIVIVSGRDDPVTVSLARAIGAQGFISKANPLPVIQEKLREVLEGRSVFPDEGGNAVAVAVSLLTPAQARVLAAAATGKLNKEIAFEMNLAESTIKTHMSAIFRRLRVNNRTQAILAISG